MQWQVKARTPLCLGQGMFTESLCLEEFLVSLAEAERNGIVSTVVIQTGRITWSDFSNSVSSFYMAPMAFLVSSNKCKE